MFQKLTEQTIRNKMTLDGISTADQDKYFNPNLVREKEDKPNPKLAKYERMKKMGLLYLHLFVCFYFVCVDKNKGMPTHAIVNKMRLDGISADDIAEFENRFVFCFSCFCVFICTNCYVQRVQTKRKKKKKSKKEIRDWLSTTK